MDLANLILSHIKSNQRDMYTTLPGRVIGLRKTQSSTTVDVQIMVNKVDAANTAEEEPELYEVPLQYPSSSGCFITLPIDVGDLVTLHFSMRALGTYMNGDGITPKTPSNRRLHNQGDVFATAPVLPYQSGREIDSEALVASSGATEIRILKDGTIELGEGATERIIKGDAFLSKFLAHTHTYSDAGSPTLTSPVSTVVSAPDSGVPATLELWEATLSEVNKTK